LVSITLSGKGDVRGLRIDETLLKPEQKEIIEDLIVAAYADARRKLESTLQEKMQALTGGLPLPPGLKLFLQRFDAYRFCRPRNQASDPTTRPLAWPRPPPAPPPRLIPHQQ